MWERRTGYLLRQQARWGNRDIQRQAEQLKRMVEETPELSELAQIKSNVKVRKDYEKPKSGVYSYWKSTLGLYSLGLPIPKLPTGSQGLTLGTRCSGSGRAIGIGI